MITRDRNLGLALVGPHALGTGPVLFCGSRNWRSVAVSRAWRCGRGRNPHESGCDTFRCLSTARTLFACLLVIHFVAKGAGLEAQERLDDALRAIPSLTADLRTLCSDIGSRMAGTKGMREAVDWALAAYADADLEAVRTEPVGMPLRWAEGKTSVRVLSPHARQVRAAASALSPPIDGKIDLELVRLKDGPDGDSLLDSERLQGAAVLVELDAVDSFQDLAVEQRRAMVALRRAAESGAAAVLFVSTRTQQVLYRHVNNIAGVLDPIPSAVVGRDDGLELLELLKSGESVRLRLALRSRVGGPYETSNVVGEIPGGEWPREVVLLGAHLDSWDMGAGCLDNAVNVALVTHVARSILAAGVRPRRTLRFVLFGGEEFGLFGSRAYVDRHRSELDDHVVALVHDMGGGPLTGYSVGGREDLLPELRSVLDATGRAATQRATSDTHFFSDNFPFMLEGVPTLFGIHDVSTYIRPYHGEADTIDKVEVDEVLATAKATAKVALEIANRPKRFGDRLGAAQVRDWLRESGLDRHLRFLGVWDSWYPRPAYDGVDLQ